MTHHVLDMPPLHDQLPPRVFPLKTLLALLAVTVGVSLWLVPRQEELVARLFKDQQYERITGLLRDELNGTGVVLDDRVLRSLSAEQIAVLGQLLRLTPREQLHAVFAPGRGPRYDVFVHGLVMAAIRYVDVISPTEAWEVISPELMRLSEAQQMEILQLLAQNALALNSPRLAAQLLIKATALPSATAAQVRRMGEACRWCSQSLRGGLEIRRWTKQHSDVPEANELLIFARDLAVEGGNPVMGLEIQLQRLERLAAANELSGAEMAETYSLAQQSGKTVSILPWIKRFVETLPEHDMSWEDLRSLVGVRPNSASEYRRWLAQLAQVSDWNSEFSTAFEMHLRLAAMGDLNSLDRCLALAGFLGRTDEVVPLLQALQPLPEREETQIILGRMLAGLGDDDAARPLYLDWVKKHPEDRQAAFEYACLVEDLGEEDAAADAFAEFVKNFPDDVMGMKKLAEGRIRQGRLNEALAVYSKMKSEDHDYATLENYAMLAESLDSHEEQVRALQLTVEQMAEPTAEIYLDIAEAASYLDDATIQTKALQGGMEKLPNSAVLRIALANAWLKLDQPELVLETLIADPRLRDNFEAVTLALSRSAEVPDPKQVLDFVGEDVNRRFSLPVSSKLDLAVLMRLCGAPDQAEQIIAGVRESKENLPLLAEARHLMGDDDEAARLLTTFLDGNPGGKASEWLFLGELYQELGRADDAQRAFDHSLNLLTAELPETAFSAQPSIPAQVIK